MQSITNEPKVVRGQRIGKIGTMVGLGFLVAGLVISLLLKESNLVWLSFACLILGLVVSSIGSLNMNRWVREPRADQALEKALKGFDDRYRLYNYYLPAPHVLLCPLGLFVMTAQGQDGVIRFEGEKVRRDFSVGRALRFMADEGLGKPFAEAEQHVNALRKFLADQDWDGDLDIQSLIVFTNPAAQLHVSDPPLPIVNPKGVKKALRKGLQSKLSTEQYSRLQEILDSAV